MQLDVHLYATLRDYAPPEAKAGVFAASLPEGGTVGNLLNALGIGTEKVHMRMVNGVGVDDDHILNDKDRLGFFPPVGGG